MVVLSRLPVHVAGHSSGDSVDITPVSSISESTFTRLFRSHSDEAGPVMNLDLYDNGVKWPPP